MELSERVRRRNVSALEVIMKCALVVTVFGILTLAPSKVLACRGLDPEDLNDDPADAIVLTTIQSVRKTGANQTFPNWAPAWVATASVKAPLFGKFTENEVEYEERGPGDCYAMGVPRVETYWVIYLRKVKDQYYPQAVPYWWAHRSGDPRVANLRRFLPLGPVRAPTPEETRILDLAEPRVRLPNGQAKLENYTRLYARSSAGIVRVRFFRSRTPQRFMLDHDEEMPDRKDCRCQIHEQFVDLEDLWKAGKLPPFEPRG